MGRYGTNRFATIDTNGDGVISADEAAAYVAATFDMMDANGDGVVTIEEFMAVRRGPGYGYGPYAQERQQRKEARFAAMDPGKTGKVTKEAFLTYGKGVYAASDDDKDGKVTPWEFRAHMRLN